MNETNIEKLEQSTDILIDKLKNLMPESMAIQTKIKGFTLARRNNPTDPLKCFYKPAILSTLQGQKNSILGTQNIVYGKHETLLTAIDIPATSKVIQASPEKPYLAVMLELDPVLTIELLKDMPPIKGETFAKKSMAVNQTDHLIIDAYIRLVELLEKSQDEQNVLAPMILREIHYRFLIGSLGTYLRSAYTKGSKSNQISMAIAWIKDNFKENFKIESLAQHVHMSASSFYRNFNKITSLSPIQYQKHLRLHEAQYLMLTGKDASHVAYLVGYESSTQFNREYKRLFGNPPKKDIKSKIIL